MFSRRLSRLPTFSSIFCRRNVLPVFKRTFHDSSNSLNSLRNIRENLKNNKPLLQDYLKYASEIEKETLS